MPQSHTKGAGIDPLNVSAAHNPHSAGTALPAVVSFRKMKAAYPPKQSGFPFQPPEVGAVPASKTVQLVIKTPTTNVTSPAQGDDPRAEKAILAEGIYLIKNEEDLKNVRKGTFGDIPMLPPFKHLIGEIHTQSRFKEAIQNWGWGANCMLEGFSANEHMADVAADDIRKDESSVYHNTLPLEDTIAKDLTSAINATRRLQELTTATGKIENAAKSVRRPLPTKEAPLTATDQIASLYRKAIDSLTTSAKQAKGPIFFLIEINQNLKNYLKTKGMDTAEKYSYLYNEEIKKSVNDALNDIEDQADADDAYYYLNHEKLQTAVTYLSQITTYLMEILQTHDSEASEQFDVPGSVKNAIQTGIDPMSPIREHYMINNINNKLGIPGLVSLGREHLNNVAAGVPNAKAHESYSTFEEETKADKVL
ncbi:hypothetical protein [Chitinophaga sp.]|uniref:hypothetical protein n=1 Tax=Chitinophaga sp. TaxID=1869181 RepID=UPI002F923F5F